MKIKEILRYIGYNSKNVDEKTLNDIHSAYSVLENTKNFKVTYKIFNVNKTENGINFENTSLTINSKSVTKLLDECEKCIVVCATLGQAVDTLLRKIQIEDMSKAIIYDACANSMLEALTDEFEETIKKDSIYFTERFGVGYGDLPLEVNLPLSQILNSNKTVGVSVSSSYLMFPKKTILAIIGIADKPQRMFIRGCKYCNLSATCQYKKTGGCNNG